MPISHVTAETPILTPAIDAPAAQEGLGRRYFAHLHAHAAVHLLRFGAAFLIASFLVELAVMLITTELRFTRRTVLFAVPAAVLQVIPALVIFMAAEALSRKRLRPLVIIGAVLALLCGAALMTGALVLVAFGFGYCPIFVPALLAAGLSLIFIIGGFRAMNAMSDPEFRAAFDRDRRPLP